MSVSTGLVLAARLSENSTATVAVIEAGDDGAAVINKILAPAQAYFAGIASLDSPYDWHYETASQSGLDDREIYWPRLFVFQSCSLDVTEDRCIFQGKSSRRVLRCQRSVFLARE